MPEPPPSSAAKVAHWLEVSLSVDAELAEAVADVLARVAPHGVVLESERLDPETQAARPGSIVVVRAYLPDDDQLASLRRRMEEGLWHLGQIQPIPEPAFRRVADTDWNELWKVSYGPTEIGQRLQIVPVWLDAPPGKRQTVWIDPGMAFGTGTHPTTRMCLAALEELLSPGQVVVDLGCGSGILGFAAAKLGAGRVFSCDTDPQAIDATTDGAARNQVAHAMEIFQGSLDEMRARLEAAGSKADLLLGNLLAPILLDLLPRGLAECVRPGGHLVLSGILADQADEVLQTSADAGLELIEVRQDGDWRALVLRRPGGQSA
ncbi:MAG TPA: 50S ribosomal protein L11 methyltransferase [Anaerolineales bacterium]|nr:50S ribosomal protein L11 methyltransferase [Anaerolineales bacterium]